LKIFVGNKSHALGDSPNTQLLACKQLSNQKCFYGNSWPNSFLALLITSQSVVAEIKILKIFLVK